MKLQGMRFCMKEEPVMAGIEFVATFCANDAVELKAKLAALFEKETKEWQLLDELTDAEKHQLIKIMYTELKHRNEMLNTHGVPPFTVEIIACLTDAFSELVSRTTSLYTCLYHTRHYSLINGYKLLNNLIILKGTEDAPVAVGLVRPVANFMRGFLDADKQKAFTWADDEQFIVLDFNVFMQLYYGMESGYRRHFEIIAEDVSDFAYHFFGLKSQQELLELELESAHKCAACEIPAIYNLKAYDHYHKTYVDVCGVYCKFLYDYALWYEHDRIKMPSRAEVFGTLL